MKRRKLILFSILENELVLRAFSFLLVALV
jgi:hypothetical protein